MHKFGTLNKKQKQKKLTVNFSSPDRFVNAADDGFFKSTVNISPTDLNVILLVRVALAVLCVEDAVKVDVSNVEPSVVVFCPVSGDDTVAVVCWNTFAPAGGSVA